LIRQRYHLSFDLTDHTPDLSLWLNTLQDQFKQAIAADSAPLKPLKILLKPEQQMIGDRVYEVAFIADTDGLPLEFIRLIN
jgi:hypothetical protein